LFLIILSFAHLSGWSFVFIGLFETQFFTPFPLFAHWSLYALSHDHSICSPVRRSLFHFDSQWVFSDRLPLLWLILAGFPIHYPVSELIFLFSFCLVLRQIEPKLSANHSHLSWHVWYVIHEELSVIFGLPSARFISIFILVILCHRYGWQLPVG
jgi:hypothetical protein